MMVMVPKEKGSVGADELGSRYYIRAYIRTCTVTRTNTNTRTRGTVSLQRDRGQERFMTWAVRNYDRPDRHLNAIKW